MTKQLYRRIGEWKPDDLLADSRDIYITTDEAIDAGASFHRGQIVKYDSTTKTIKAMTAKSDIPFGIVVRDVNCSENADENGDLFATVYVRGSFNGQSSLLDAGAIPAEDLSHEATPLNFEDFYVALRERGIIIRRNVN